jgi:hypothetical protein
MRFFLTLLIVIFYSQIAFAQCTTPTITASGQTTFCQGGNVVLNSSTAAGWSYQWKLNGTNIPGATSPSYTANASGSYTVTISDLSLTCSATSNVTSVTVNSFPEISNKSTTICSGTAFSQTPTNVGGDIVPSGTTYSWTVGSNANITGQSTVSTAQNSISQTLTNSTNTSQNITYTVTPSSGSCVGSTFTVIVTVSPKPTIANKTNTICSGTAFTQAPTNGSGDIVPLGTTYTWTIGSNTNITGQSTVATAQNSISQNLTNSTNVSQNLTYTVTPSSGSCVGSTFTVIVSVSPKPTIANKTNTICSGTAFTQAPTNGSGDIVPLGTTYTWTIGSNTNITGQSTVTTAQNSISQNLTNSTNVSQNLTYTVTPSSGSCVGSTFTVIVTVSPKPTIANKTNTICSGTAFTQAPTNGSGDIVPLGTTYTWTVGSNTNITGQSTVATAQNSISQNLTNSTNTSQNLTYTVTPFSGSCEGSTFTVIVSVSPKPSISSNTNTTSTSCSQAAFSLTPANVGGDIVPAGTTYTWAVGSNANLTGQSAVSAAQNSISQTLTNSTNVSQNINYTVTPTSGLCVGSSFNLTVTIKPKPNIILNLQKSICSEQSVDFTPQDGINGIVPIGTTITWNVINNINVNGEAPNSLQNVGVINQVLTNLNYANNLVTYQILPAANGCVGSAFDFNVTVNKAPRLLVTANSSICAGGSIQLYAVDSLNTGQLFYNWTNAATLSNPFIYNPIASPIANTTYTVSVIDNTNQCQVSKNVTINVVPQVAAISFTTPTSFCQGGSVTLTANAGLGLSYQWKLNDTAIPGATTIAYPAISSGVYSVVVTNSNGCEATSIGQTVIVYPNPVATISSLSSTTFCDGESVILTTSAITGNSYQWTRNGINLPSANSNSFEVFVGGNYAVQIVNSSVASVSCSSISPVLNIVVNSLPSATITPSNGVLCQGINTVLNANAGSGLTYQWRLNNVAISGATNSTITANNSGIYSVLVTNSSMCNQTSQGVIVNSLPIADISNLSSTTFCQGESVILNTTNVVGNTYQWRLNGEDISGENLYSFEADQTGNYSVVVTNANSCSAQSPSVNVTVHSLPSLTVSADDLNLCSGESTNLHVTGANNYTWTPASFVSNSTSSNPNAFPTSTTNFGVTGTDVNGCSDYQEIQIVVEPNPSLDLPTSIAACEGTNVTLPGIGSIVWSGVTSSNNFNAQQSGYAIAVLQNSNLCSAVDSIYIQVNALPLPNISGADTVCANSFYVEYSVPSTGSLFSWNVSNGELQGVDNGNSSFIHWFDQEYGSSTFVTITEHDINTGCEGSDTLFVEFDGLAPNTTNVSLLYPNGSTLFAADHYAIMNWGSTIISTNVDEYTDGHFQYYTYENFDTALRYYWIEAGEDSSCLTRSYFNAPVWQVSVQEIQEDYFVRVYPNPTSGILNLSIDAKNSISGFSIYDCTGQLVKQDFNFKNQSAIDVSDLQVGFYVMKFVADNGMYYNQSFIKK